MRTCGISVYRLLHIALACGFVFVAVAGAASDAEAAKTTKVQRCKKLFRLHYAKAKGHKAIATSGGRALGSPDTACGFAYQYGSKKTAISEALRQCRITDKRFKAPGKCQIIEAK